MKCCSFVFLLALATGLTGLRADETQSGLFDPAGLYLTWQRDPTTTMTIDWHTVGETDRTRIEYRELGQTNWESAQAGSFPFPFSDRMVHRTELSGLTPMTTYEFRFGEKSVKYRFRTMPADTSEPIRFIAGGDTRHRKDWMEEMNRQAMKFDPSFIVWGGDLAYADGREDRVDRWHEFFDAIKETLVTEEGRMIPIVVTIGNHEVQGFFYFQDKEFAFDVESRERIAPYFYRLFAMPGHPGYNVLDFGDYLSLILLDTNHTNPIENEQSRWLARVLAGRQDVPHVFPVYHVAGFPSYRSYEGRTESAIREHWVPLFERFGVRVAFENHDHTYKRTHPILRGEVHPNGVVYIGDGAWGVNTRELRNVDAWYIKRAESVRHGIVVTLHGTQRHFMAVGADGEIIDEFPAAPR